MEQPTSNTMRHHTYFCDFCYWASFFLHNINEVTNIFRNIIFAICKILKLFLYLLCQTSSPLGCLWFRGRIKINQLLIITILKGWILIDNFINWAYDLPIEAFHFAALNKIIYPLRVNKFAYVVRQDNHFILFILPLSTSLLFFISKEKQLKENIQFN